MKSFISNKLVMGPLALTLCALVWPTCAIAKGGGGTGGGQGIVCRNDDGSVRTAELLDLAEARGYYSLNLVTQPKNKPYLEIARENALKLDAAIPGATPMGTWSLRSGDSPLQSGYDVNPSAISPHLDRHNFTKDTVEHIDQNKKLIPGRLKIPPTTDAHPRILPSEKNCSIEQVALYTDGDNEVHIVEEIWKELSNVDRAALLVHEALYRNLRSFGETDSDRARKTVGHLFAGMKFNWVFEGVPLERFLVCWTEGGSFQFAVYPKDDKFIAQFLVYDGDVMLTRTATSVDGLPFAKLFGMSVPSHMSSGVFREIKDAMLEKTGFFFNVNIDSAGKVSPSLSAGSGRATTPVICNSHLTHVRASAGFIQVGPTP